MTEEIRFFLPGPTYVTESVREAMTHPAIGHRSPEFKALYRRLAPKLQQVFRTEGDVLVATGSATLVMEASVLSTVQSDVLNLTNGAFSERWHAVSQSIGKTADALAVPWGQAIDPDDLRKALREKKYEAVTLCHNETSTGVLNPIQELAAVIREESDALVLVDCVSAMGGAQIEADAWGIDIVIAGVQKAMALPPGIIVFTFSDRAVARAKGVPHRGFYTDLLRYKNKHADAGTITTPATPILFAMDVQLDAMLEEGMEARWQRHLDLRSQTAAWVGDRGMEFAADEAVRSPTVTCVRPGGEVDAPTLVSQLAERGYVVGSGYGKWKPETFRIGHMGEVRSADLDKLLALIDELTGAHATG